MFGQPIINFKNYKFQTDQYLIINFDKNELQHKL